MAKLPKILHEWLEDTEQFDRARELGITLSDSHLLAEAEWCLYNCYENAAGTCYFEYSAQAKAGLRRWAKRMRANGVRPSHDFDL